MELDVKARSVGFGPDENLRAVLQRIMGERTKSLSGAGVGDLCVRFQGEEEISDDVKMSELSKMESKSTPLQITVVGIVDLMLKFNSELI